MLQYLYADLLIYALLLFLDLLLEFLEGGAVRCGAVSLEDLDIPSRSSVSQPMLLSTEASLLVCQRCDLLLFNFIIGEVLLILLPVLACRGRLWRALACDDNDERFDGGNANHDDGPWTRNVL